MGYTDAGCIVNDNVTSSVNPVDKAQFVCFEKSGVRGDRMSDYPTDSPKLDKAPQNTLIRGIK
ncbi:uncharacterized protein PHALS_09012 [Plasmopara halstedii]|uniref:Uncharacterized protein n=1 Tax=Plasmopara halstedii TaxID=4781 RepID=A0A0P1ADC0_PLAHL|nr:uncharacterized protein PHALS_09012 [Plasmopara halstedii]CEG38970.1 hypothetical protein PHALS_09012 [Plasmopara halstedii]|eukprot:XP_024575339.1 hypothetical protein PHALS_09012 [Plasmopara halstedii]